MTEKKKKKKKRNNIRFLHQGLEIIFLFFFLFVFFLRFMAKPRHDSKRTGSVIFNVTSQTNENGIVWSIDMRLVELTTRLIKQDILHISNTNNQFSMKKFIELLRSRITNETWNMYFPYLKTRDHIDISEGVAVYSFLHKNNEYNMLFCVAHLRHLANIQLIFKDFGENLLNDVSVHKVLFSCANILKGNALMELGTWCTVVRYIADTLKLDNSDEYDANLLDKIKRRETNYITGNKSVAFDSVDTATLVHLDNLHSLCCYFNFSALQTIIMTILIRYVQETSTLPITDITAMCGVGITSVSKASSFPVVASWL